jgi:hypothetical protein
MIELSDIKILDEILELISKDNSVIYENDLKSKEFFKNIDRNNFHNECIRIFKILEKNEVAEIIYGNIQSGVRSTAKTLTFKKKGGFIRRFQDELFLIEEKDKRDKLQFELIATLRSISAIHSIFLSL